MGRKLCIDCGIKPRRFDIEKSKSPKYCGDCIKKDKYKDIKLIEVRPDWCVGHLSIGEYKRGTKKYDGKYLCKNCAEEYLKDNNDVEIKNMRTDLCKYCDKRANFNKYWETKGLYCKECARKNFPIDFKNKIYLNVVDKKCDFCHQTQPNHKLNNKRACSKCAKNIKGMIRYRGSFCPCGKIPSYGYDVPICCSKCAKPDMQDVKHTFCQEPNCINSKGKRVRAHYNYKGKKNPLYCSVHGLAKGMVCVSYIECDEDDCEYYSYYGFPGNTPSKCSEHKLEGMIRQPNKKCLEKLCFRNAIYGYYGNNAIKCDHHYCDDMINLCIRKCLKCNGEDILTKDGFCSICDPTLYEQFINKRLGKQKTIKLFLDNSGYNYIYKYQYDKIIDKGICGKERPDFLFESKNKTHFVIIECDEYQHKSEKFSCEEIRMKNITNSLGSPTIFIRYNPDSYMMNGEKIRDVEPGKRLPILKNVLDFYLNINVEQLQTLGLTYAYYLYYDNYHHKYNIITHFDEEY